MAEAGWVRFFSKEPVKRPAEVRRLKIFAWSGSPAQVELMKGMIPLGRVGSPEDAAGAVYLFCAPESDYVSGEVLVAAGGLRM